MEIRERKTVDMLTNNSVSILTQKFIDLNGTETQVGDNNRKAYVNSVSGREELQSTEPSDVIDAVLARWGDTPSLEDEPEVVTDE